MLSKKPKVFLIDASPIFYRAFFAVPPLTSKNGIPTNAVYGFMSTLIKILKEHKPQHLVICFDNKSNHRKEIFPQYKEDRKPMDSKLQVQIPMLKDLINTMGIRVAEIAGYEADDLIGMLAKWSESKGADVVIISPDKDMTQLVNENIKILDVKNNVLVGADEVKIQHGVGPEHIVDLLALSGDASDGIPGVFKVGAKTAINLIKQYGSVEEIYKDLTQIKQKGLRENLEKGRDMAKISKNLATIITSMELEYSDLFDVERGFIQHEKIKAQFDALNFASLQSRIKDIE